MKHIIPPLAVLALQLPYLVTAQCPACDTYRAALNSCQTTSSNLSTIGNTMDTSSVHCMCVASSSATQINTCQGCAISYHNTSPDIQVLLAWYNTCKADGQYGEQQAVACWEGQPTDYLPCVSNTLGKGSETPIGGAGLTALTSSPGSPLATVAPTTLTKSDAALPFKARSMFSIMMVALGVGMGA